MAVASIAVPGASRRASGARLSTRTGAPAPGAAVGGKDYQADQVSYLPLGPLQGLTVPPPRLGLWTELRGLLDALDSRWAVAPPAPPEAAPEPAPLPAPAPQQAPSPAPSIAEATYSVRSGDSLSAIAARLLGDANRWRDLYEANRDIVGPNPNLIHPGQVLRIPGAEGRSRASAAAPAPGPAPAPAPSPGPSIAGRARHISQYSPAGKEQGYTNGQSNCGPTSMAMVARAIGYRNDLSDAKLINHLGGIGRTTEAGTGVNGISAMAQAMGLAAQTRGPGAAVDWIAAELRAGKMVVANGDYFAMAPHEDPGKTSGHYVLVYGIDSAGRYLVHDPADRRVTSVSAAELKKFISSNANGGYQISMGR